MMIWPGNLGGCDDAPTWLYCMVPAGITSEVIPERTRRRRQLHKNHRCDHDHRCVSAEVRMIRNWEEEGEGAGRWGELENRIASQQRSMRNNEWLWQEVGWRINNTPTLTHANVWSWWWSSSSSSSSSWLSLWEATNKTSRVPFHSTKEWMKKNVCLSEKKLLPPSRQRRRRDFILFGIMEPSIYTLALKSPPNWRTQLETPKLFADQSMHNYREREIVGSQICEQRATKCKKIVQ